MTSTLGYTEFVPLNLKAVFTKVDLSAKKVTTNIIYQDQTIATFIFSLPENIILERGDINSIGGLQELDIDEEYVVWRLKPIWHSLLEHEITEPDDFLV
ncbi:hypothetical protein MHI43_17155 [Paenibacillus sp. FSL H8-0457]|uniref:hypothetical protein n=1 Tax=Paenibacillus TaxID=44249 RepID=UPI0003E2B8DE|nr:MULTISPECIES: hypothetical protein [Paenibacillus]ETT66847.1 hypothetical protein C172_07144 [Paenibacillus sp. FSL H8-457]MCM3258075.1 hypothetical protein [Paenibacillus lautus]